MARTKKADKDQEARSKRKLALEAFLADGLYDEEDPKHDKKIKRDGVGRPTVITKQVIKKLIHAYKIGCPHKEAAFFAGISIPTLDRFRKDNPDFDEQIEAWQESTSIAARENISEAIKTMKSVGDSWMHLRAHKKAEFAEQKNLNVNTNVVSVDDLEKAATEGVVPTE